MYAVHGYPYHYPIPDATGAVDEHVSGVLVLSREEFIRITHIDPVTGMHVR